MILTLCLFVFFWWRMKSVMVTIRCLIRLAVTVRASALVAVGRLSARVRDVDAGLLEPGEDHSLEHLSELLSILDPDVGLDHSLLLLLVLLPGGLPLLLGQVLVHLVLQEAVVVVDAPHH